MNNSFTSQFFDGTHTQRLTFRVQDEHLLNITLHNSNAEATIVISEAHLRICAIERNHELMYYNDNGTHAKTVRLYNELIKVLRAECDNSNCSWKASFIRKNHITAIIEKITSDALLHSTYFGATQNEVLGFLN